MKSIILELIPVNGHIYPYETPYGHVFRGVLMKWLSDVDPKLAHELHEYQKIRPYSIKRFINKREQKINFSFTTYDDNMINALLKDLIISKKPEFNIGQKKYKISEIDLKELDLNDLVKESKAVRSLNIRFLSPVYFNTLLGDYPVRFPLPVLFFGNLTNIWNDIYKERAKIERDKLMNWINAHVYISSYKMKTIRRDIGKKKPVYGGIGNTSFRVKRINKRYYKHLLEDLNRPQDHELVNQDYEDNCRWLEILCRLGEYTNVGANRTAGLGVIKYYPKRTVREKDLLSNITTSNYKPSKRRQTGE